MKLYDKIMLFYREISTLETIRETLNWDMNVNLPAKAISNRSEQLALISKYIHKLVTNIHFANDIYDMIENGDFDTLNDIQKKEIIKLKRIVENELKIPESLKQELIKITTIAYGDWEEAKETGDDSKYLKDLKRIVELKIEYAKCKGYNKNPYDALIDDYDTSLDYDYIEPIFDHLQKSIINILKKVGLKGNISGSKLNEKNINSINKNRGENLKFFLEKSYQEKISYELLNILKISNNNLNLSISMHPFSANLGIDDFRITTNYNENDIFSNIYSVLHEAGHAIYEMEVQKLYPNSPISYLDSLSLHESQSRFFENFLGKNKKFIEYILPRIKKVCDGNLDFLTFDDFYNMVNSPYWTPIRIDSCELYYNLHIILRTNIENKLINGEIGVENINDLWNSFFENIFNYKIKDKREGYLQDVHWAGGDFGYFPTYTIGNIIATQFGYKINEEYGIFDNDFTDETIDKIKDWFRDNLYKYGSSISSKEIVKKVTGNDIDPGSLIDYLEKKYI